MLSSLQALRARYEGRTREEAFHLVKARHWSLGHNVVLRSLVSDAIINGKKMKLLAMVMRRSIRNFNISPGIPRAFDCASCPGRNLNVALEGWGI